MDTVTTENLTISGLDQRLVFSVPEVAELLGVSRAFGYELVARGDLPSLRLGRRLVVPRAALLALVGVSTPPG
jgi:excisionase family DNA binding protein